MSNKTRKHIWPGALAMSIAIIGALAAFLVLAGNPVVTQAHAPGDHPNTNFNVACADMTDANRAIHNAIHANLGQHGTMDPCPDTTNGGGNGNGNGNGMMGDAAGTLESSSTSGGSGVELILTIDSMPMNAAAGSSVELYLEDDFQVPDDIARDTVYFTVPDGGNDQNGGGRVYSADPIEIDDDDHFGGDDDWSIRVFIPDMNNAENSGYDGPTMGQTVNLVFSKAAGIKNPTEAGTHSVGFSVLDVNDVANDGPAYRTDKVYAKDSAEAMAAQIENDKVSIGMRPATPHAESADVGLKTLAKISLDDEDAGRGKVITVTGSGFNNGTNAEVRVLVSKDSKPSCQMVMADGEKLGAAPVGSDDKFTVTFTVHQDEFKAGDDNYICAADSEAGAPRFASAVKAFDLEPSVTVSPDSASFGDEVTIKPRDFTNAISSITFGTSHIWKASEANDDLNGCADGYDAGDQRDDTLKSTIVCMKEKDGSDYIFDVPGGLDAQIQIAVKDGVDTKRIYMGVVPSSLELSQSEVAPNASVIISGSGFTEDSRIYTDKITIDGKALDVDNAGTQVDGDGDRYVQVTSNGEFTATVRIWTANANDDNPALDDDEYTIKAVDEDDFEGETKITILEPTVSVSPDTASPRDYIVISGENWPISTADDDHEVNINVDGRNRSANIDGNGRFRYEYQLRSTIGIGDEHEVIVTFPYGGDDDAMEEEATFNVTEAELGLEPGMAAPGQTITVSVQGMPPYTLVDHVKIDGANRLGGRNINTDREGDAMVTDILVPFLDPGFYPVEVKVGQETRVAQLEVLAEAVVPGVAATLPGAVSDLSDNLEAVFHFNNTSKAWTFYDPRPEFADLNTLTELNSGQPYWVLVKESQEEVDWNGRLVSFTCAADDCWNLEIW